MFDIYAVSGVSILFIAVLVIYIVSIYTHPEYFIRNLNKQSSGVLPDDMVPALRFHELLKQYELLEGLPDYKSLSQAKYLNRGYFEFGYDEGIDEFRALIWSGYFSRADADDIMVFLEKSKGFALEVPPHVNGESVSGYDQESGIYYAARFLIEEMPTGETYRYSQVFVSPSDDECRSAVQLMRSWPRTNNEGYSHWQIDQILNGAYVSDNTFIQPQPQPQPQPTYRQQSQQLPQPMQPSMPSQAIGYGQSVSPPPPQFNPINFDYDANSLNHNTANSLGQRIHINANNRANWNKHGY